MTEPVLVPGLVALVDPVTGRFSDSLAPPSVAANTAAAAAAATAAANAKTAAETASTAAAAAKVAAETAAATVIAVNADAVTVDNLGQATTLGKSLAKAADATIARAAISAVGKGEIVFNVKDHGAVGDWSTGTTGTADTTAINSCMTAAAAATAVAGGQGGSVTVLFPPTTGNGYKTDDTITVPQGVNLDMRSPIVYTGPAGRPALVVGPTTGSESYRNHVIRVRRATLSDWTDEADKGVVIQNHYQSAIDIVQCNNFTVGATFLGINGVGFSYNRVTLGALSDNKIAVDCTNDTGGWCNENDFYGGRLTNSSSTYTSLDRVGVRITSRATTKYYNNALVFHKPSFELKGAAIAGNSICMLVEYGTNSGADRARHESNSPEVLVQQNNSAGCWMDFAYTDEGANAPVMVRGAASGAGYITRAGTAMRDRAMRVIHKVDALHKRACYYDGATLVNVPGLTVGTSGTTNTDARAVSSLVINPDYLEVSSGRYVGFYMSTRNLKRFTVFRDVEAGFGGRVIVRCYDSSGAILSAAGTTKTEIVASALGFLTGFGGAWRTGADTANPQFVEVSDTTDYVFIGVTGGTAAARLRTLSVATLEPMDAATWLAFPDNGQNYATTPPTAGTWAVGRVLVNAAPASGAPAYWVCTTGGTPGTWAPVYAGTSAAPAADVQVFTTNGTWTKPTGATRTEVFLQGGGCGGGSGRRGAAGTIRCGGGGGGGGSRTQFTFSAALLPASVTVAVGTGGSGGAAVTADDTNGSNGAAGGASAFGTYARAGVGSGGGGGTATTGTAGGPGAGQLQGGAGSAASTTGLAGGNATSLVHPAAAGGAAGGGISAANVASNGGAGIMSSSVGGTTTAGGVVDTTSPVAASAGVSNIGLPGGSGGGGAASITTAAQAGVAGGIYGGGGSGGGASLNGNNSGAGGDGAPGIVVVIST